jgi:NADPH2:quinone reductase
VIFSAIYLLTRCLLGCLAVSARLRFPDWFLEDFLVLLELLRADKIHPVVSERLRLTDACRAHELLEESASVGRLVLVPLD